MATATAAATASSPTKATKSSSPARGAFTYQLRGVARLSELWRAVTATSLVSAGVGAASPVSTCSASSSWRRCAADETSTIAGSLSQVPRREGLPEASLPLSKLNHPDTLLPTVMNVLRLSSASCSGSSTPCRLTPRW
jgi:hypothetical protein